LSLIKNEQFYSYDETSLNFKMCPSKTLASCEEKSTPGFKEAKNKR
jgi:hypothetical protein